MTIKNSSERLEYEERLRQDLIMEEYYKLKADHPERDTEGLLILAAETIREKRNNY